MLKQLVVFIFNIGLMQCQHESSQRCARSINACFLAPESIEGPFYWNSTVRQDITDGKPGIPLSLSITVVNTNSCFPISDAIVDLWHCDGTGLYSHFIAASQGNMGGRTDNSTFFRGQQLTNSKGIATFKTIYPGWYPGRATHMHVKVHIGATLANVGGAIYAKGGHVSHTGQIYFDDNLSDKISTLAPYSTHAIRRTRNNEDGIYRGSKGVSMIVPIKFSGTDFTGGLKGEITLGVDPTATPSPVEFFSRKRAPRPFW